MKKLIPVLILLLCPVFSFAEEAEPVDSAISWLHIVDSGDYNESWEQAAPYFKGSISSSSWSQLINQVRAPLGGVKSRQVQSAQAHKTLPGIPDGDYVVISLSSAFERKKSAIETITVSNVEGVWRVIGYFIK